MNDRELTAPLNDLESHRVERKSSASDSDPIEQAICAFANDLPNHRAPGVIFVGVRDAGLSEATPMTDELLVRLGQFRGDDTISPIPSLVAQKRRLDG